VLCLHTPIQLLQHLIDFRDIWYVLKPLEQFYNSYSNKMHIM